MEQKEAIEALFKSDLVNKFNSYKKTNQTSLSDEESFLFACINATIKITNIADENMKEYENYRTDLVSRLVKKEDLDNNTKFGLDRFLGEIMQNSIDHCNLDSQPIDIVLEFHKDGSFEYRHNGRHFECEKNKVKNSTLTGLYQIGTKLKRFNFMIGTFGIGFKSWVLHYKYFTLRTVYQNKLFLAKIQVENNIFNIINLEFNDEVNEPNSISFKFNDPLQKIDLTESLPNLSNHARSIIESSYDKPINFQIKYEHTEICISSTIAQKQIGEVTVSEIKIVEKNNSTHSQYDIFRIPIDISKVSNEQIDTKKTFEEWLVEKYNRETENTDEEIKFKDWQQTKHFSALLFDNREESTYPLFSVQQTVVDEEPTDAKSKIRLDGRFELDDDRKKFDIYARKANEILLREMTFQHSETMYQNLGSLKEHNLIDWLFLDLSQYIDDKYANEDMSVKYNQIYPNYKELVQDEMINPAGDNILQINLEPHRIAKGAVEDVDEFIEWCENNISVDKIKEIFPEVPCLTDGTIIKLRDSFPVRNLEKEISIESILDRLEKAGTGMVNEFLNSNINLSKYSGMPLQGGALCVLLLEEDDTEFSDSEVSPIITKLAANKGRIVVSKPGDERYEDYKDQKDRKDIQEINSETTAVEIRSFILDHTGGHPLSKNDFQIVKGFCDKRKENLFPGKVSFWEPERQAYGLETKVIIRVPKFDTDLNMRSIALSEDDKISLGFIGEPSSKIGEPSSKQTPTATPKEDWWEPKNLPKIADEGKNIFYLKNQENYEIIEEKVRNRKNFIIIAQPFNNNLIMQCIGEEILGKGVGFIKADIDSKYTDELVKIYQGPLPKAMRIRLLEDFALDSYYQQDLCIDRASYMKDQLVTKDVQLNRNQDYDFNPGSMNSDDEKKSFYHKDKGFVEFINYLNTKIKNNKKYKTGFVLTFPNWHEIPSIMNSDRIDEGSYKIRAYSESISVKPTNKATVGDFRDIHREYAGRIGQAKARRPVKLGMTLIPYRSRNLVAKPKDMILPKGDGIESLISELSKKSGNKNSMLTLPRDLQNTNSKLRIDQKSIHSHSINWIDANYYTDEMLKRTDFSGALSNYLTEHDFTIEWLNHMAEGKFLSKIPIKSIVLTEVNKHQYKSQIENPVVHKWLDSIEIKSEEDEERELRKLIATEQKFSIIKSEILDTYFSCYKMYKKGLEEGKIKVINTKSKKFISERFKDEYLDPRSDGKKTTYQKWTPNSHYIVINDEFGRVTKELFSEQKSVCFGTDNLLIPLSIEVAKTTGNNENKKLNEKISTLLELENVIENYPHWQESLEQLCTFYSEYANLENNLQPILVMPEKAADFTCEIFGNNLCIGNNGWDIIQYDKSNQMFFIMNEEDGPNYLKAECLDKAARRFIRTKSLNEQNFLISLIKKTQEKNLATVFELAKWKDEYLNVDLDNYIDKCNKEHILEVFDTSYNALNKIWETNGHPPLNDEDAKNFHIGMVLKEQEQFGSEALIDDGKMEKKMKEWYQGLYSAASDEPKIDFDGYESRFNYRDIMAKGSNKKQSELKEKGLLYFFGCRLPLGLIFSNIAHQSDGVTLNQKEGRNLEQWVQKIADGELAVPENKLVMIPDALLIKGQSKSSLTIHVFHLVAMAAMEKLLLENDF